MKILTGLLASSALLLSACEDQMHLVTETKPSVGLGLQGSVISPLRFSNPYPQIPAQCYTETSRGAQNTCQYCHTNAAYKADLGNNNPQAGAEPRIGNFQLEYAYAPYDSYAPLASVNHWENTLKPEVLRQVVASLGLDPLTWDMQTYIRSDNWQAAFEQRKGDLRAWDAGLQIPFRLFPALNPQDLPAKADGFVRSTQAKQGLFQDEQGWLTGWRALNFMPYGIFTPLTGSVSGVYIRLPVPFMQTEAGEFDLAVYQANLDLLEQAIQDRLTPTSPKQYWGKAQSIKVERGLYPLGTEFAHPLHYVDVQADGSDPSISPFPGTRSRRVKEIRYMYKTRAWQPSHFRPAEKAEGSGIYGNDEQGWVDNGAGWLLAGFIEDKNGGLRPQTREEMTQCIACHSGITRTEFPSFTSGTGNTIDSTWALARKFSGHLGWQEMNYLSYQADKTASPSAVPGQAQQADPINRSLGVGELRYFLETVVGASLYGEMPASIESWLAHEIRQEQGYSADWPRLRAGEASTFQQTQALRQRLMRELTAKGKHLQDQGQVQGVFLYPPQQEALAAAARYRQVVVSQRYHFGKDVFAATPWAYRHFREPAEALTTVDGRPYQTGELITERAVELDDPASFTYRAGNTRTGIDENRPYPLGNYNPEYSPLLK